MGEAKRKRATKSLQASLEELRQEGQGVWQIEIFGPESFAGLLHNAMNGDGHAGGVIKVVATLVKQMHAVENTSKSMLCLLCDHAFKMGSGTMPMAWVLMYPMRDDPTQCIGNGVCAACYARYPSAEALGPAVTDYYRRNMITDLRVLPPLSEPGRA